MLDVLFVIAFFFMLLLTGVSLFGVIAALVVAFALMILAGLFTFTVKMLPWLILAVVVVWIYRRMQPPRQPRDKYGARTHRYRTRRFR